MGWFEKNHKIP